MVERAAMPAFATAYTMASALGVGNAATALSLRNGQGGLRPYPLRAGAGGQTWLGVIDGLADAPLEGNQHEYDCRSNRVMCDTAAQDGFMDAVAAARERYGAKRIGCFLGSIAVGLRHLEESYIRRTTGQDAWTRIATTSHLFSGAEYCCKLFGIAGPAATISTACSSSAKIFCTAARYLSAGLCDAAVVGAVDCANEGFIYGFRSLGLLSTAPCRPWDRRRDGLSIGEGAGFVLLERVPRQDRSIALLGFGESVDAYHLTGPHPTGAGAEIAMRSALAAAGLHPRDIDYVNLHGSGTPANDNAEDQAICRLFGSTSPCSSTKSGTGHAQGAAGMIEAVISMLAIAEGIIPATLNSTEPDPTLRAGIVRDPMLQPVRRVLSNSFGFGGNNCAVIFGAA
jgi:3-oxoacyl-[acyl-carrier-protein] synthase-1